MADSKVVRSLQLQLLVEGFVVEEAAVVLEGLGGGLRQGDEHGHGVGVGQHGQEDAVYLAGERAHVHRPPLAEVDVLQAEARPGRDDERGRQVGLGAAPLLQEVHRGPHVVVVDAALGLLHQAHPARGHQVGRRGLGAGQHEGVAGVGGGELRPEAAAHVDGEEELDAQGGRRGEGDDPGAPDVRRQRLEGGAGRPGLEAAEVGRREGDARGAARAQGAAVVVDEGEVEVGGGASPGVEEVGGGDAVAETVADGRTQNHSAASQLRHLRRIIH
uniref:Uncharacterized protein n=1 Tax=Oryza brachyantha TaxID=4533 RepID=J3KVM7_ORYBR